MEPFDLLPYWDEAALDAALPPRPGRAAYVELHNLIAAADAVRDFGPDDLARIGRRHGVDLRRAFRTERLALYAAYLRHVLGRGAFGEHERHTLGHLARTLSLDADDLRPLHEEAFGRTVSSALADDCLSLEERLLLYTLQHTLGFDPGEVNEAYEAAARERLLLAVARVLCNGELSPEEADAIEALEEALDVPVPARVEALLDEAAWRWRLRHGPLPSMEVGVPRRSGEQGHFSTPGRWREVNYALLRMHLREHRELLHRGQTTGLRVPDHALMGRKWHEGRLVVTSRRLVLIRHGKESTDYGLGSVVDVERYVNGVRISIKGSRTFLIDAGSTNPSLYAVLWRVLHPGQPLPERPSTS